MTETDGAGPRRYAIKLDVKKEAVGTIFSALIDQVEHPQLTTNAEGGHRIVFVCTKDQLNDIVPLVNDASDKIFIGPYNPEPKMQPAVFVPPKPRTVTTPVQREFDHRSLPRRKHGVNGAAARVEHSASGKIAMQVAKSMPVSHPVDFVEALTAAGFSPQSWGAIVSSLVAEGSLVRIGRGAYRVPTLSEYEARDKAFSEQSGPLNTD